MRNKIQIGVCYCGGCNSRYDRVSLVQQLAAELPGLELVPAEDAGRYPAALICHGCQTRCTGVSRLSVPAARQIPLSGAQDLKSAKQKLMQLLEPG